MNARTGRGETGKWHLTCVNIVRLTFYIDEGIPSIFELRDRRKAAAAKLKSVRQNGGDDTLYSLALTMASKIEQIDDSITQNKKYLNEWINEVQSKCKTLKDNAMAAKKASERRDDAIESLTETTELLEGRALKVSRIQLF